MPQSQQLTIEQAISMAEEAVNQGNAALALELYNAVLQNQPNHPVAKEAVRKIQNGLPRNQSTQVEITNPPQDQINALINLYHSGQMVKTEQLCRDLLKIYPQSLDTINVLGAALQVQGKLQEAVASYNKVIQIKPDYAEAYNNRGNALKDLGQLDEAVTSYSKAIQIRPDYAEAYYNRGNALQELGQLDDALASYNKTIQIRPDFAEAYYNRGNALQELGQLEEALASYNQAIQIRPDYAEAYSNRGKTLKELGQLDEALASYSQAIQIRPDYAEAYSNRGNALKELGQWHEAVTSYNQAIKIRPDFAEAYYNRGYALKDLGQLKEALASYNKAIQIRPDYPEAHNSLGNALKDLGQLDEAVASYNQAIQIRPDYADAYSNRLFTLNYAPDLGADEIFLAYREYDKHFGVPGRDLWQPYTNSRSPDRKLKIGYVSPDFRKHSARHFFEPLLSHHDTNHFEVYAFAELNKDDQFTVRYQGYVDHWVLTKGLDDEQLAEQIRSLGIDILIDLAGHSKGNRLGVFALKPAPVSVSWLGYGYTTGLSAIDYYLTDVATVPHGDEHLFSEKPWRLKTPSFAYRPAEGMGDVGLLPALERGFITFGTLTRAVRINYRTIRVWSEILKRTDNTRLIVNSRNFDDSYVQKEFIRRFADEGIDEARLEIGFSSPPWDLMRSIDIGLDCFPHNSGTTLFEHLYMGAPYITLAGRPGVGRIGSSILEGVGHSEWIATSEEEYIEKAVELASDQHRLAEIRGSLRGEMESSAVMDEDGFTNKVEQAYREMWRDWCSRGETRFV